MSYVEEFCEDIVIINKGTVALEGNLKELKKTFGENRIILSASNYTPDKLSEIMEDKFKNLAGVHDIRKDFIILELTSDTSKNDLLKEIMNTDIDIEKFGIYEPSLNDIFVLKAGDK